MLRGHEDLWQDTGVFGVFHPDDGWCRRDADGIEPGGAKGVVCDVIPDGIDMVGWFGVGFAFVLASGFYLWYWPNVRRWATALVITRGRGRFRFHLSLHNVVGLVTLVPLLVIAFTGAAFAFPNMKSWYENLTPAARDHTVWEAPEDAYVSSTPEDGAEPLDADQAVAAVREAFPERAIHVVEGPPADETGTWNVWTSQGHDNWTREGAAGNAYVIVDQWTGEVRADAASSDVNVAEQAVERCLVPAPHRRRPRDTEPAGLVRGGAQPDPARRHRRRDVGRAVQPASPPGRDQGGARRHRRPHRGLTRPNRWSASPHQGTDHRFGRRVDVAGRSGGVGHGRGVGAAGAGDEERRGDGRPGGGRRLGGGDLTRASGREGLASTAQEATGAERLGVPQASGLTVGDVGGECVVGEHDASSRIQVPPACPVTRTTIRL